MNGLTKQHLRIISCVGEGCTHKEIAAELGYKRQTVSYHVTTIYKTLNMNRIEQLVRTALAFGLCSPLCLMLLLAPNAAAAQVFLTVSNPPSTVQLAWTPPVLSPTNAPVTFYRVYLGTGSGQYTTMTNVGNVTNITLVLPLRGATYFFAITATDSNGLQSPFSNEVNYYSPLPPSPPTQKPLTIITVMKSQKPDGVFADAGMNWSDTPDQPSAYYKLKIDKGMILAVTTPPVPR